MEDNKIKRKVLRISILGDSSTGKTSIINRFLGNEFTLAMISNIGIDKQEILRKMKDGNEMKIILWDTAGQERFHSISSSTIKNSQGIIVCFALDNEKSFKNVSEWLNTIHEENAKISIVLFGNKCDLKDKRKVSEEEAKSFADQHGIPYFETSVKDNINLEEGLDKILEDAYAKSGKESGMKLKPVENAPKKKCCK